jgi:DNA-binding NtrC family response regulator
LPLPRHILSVAPNRCLRTTREEIFERAGYAVTSLSSIFDALRKLSGNGDAFDIVVVCGCIPAEERSRFIATIKATSPTTPILLIGEEREPLTDDAVRGLDGPELLLNHVAGLLAR